MFSFLLVQNKNLMFVTEFKQVLCFHTTFLLKGYHEEGRKYDHFDMVQPSCVTGVTTEIILKLLFR